MDLPPEFRTCLVMNHLDSLDKGQMVPDRLKGIRKTQQGHKWCVLDSSVFFSLIYLFISTPDFKKILCFFRSPVDRLACSDSNENFYDLMRKRLSETTRAADVVLEESDRKCPAIFTNTDHSNTEIGNCSQNHQSQQIIEKPESDWEIRETKPVVDTPSEKSLLDLEFAPNFSTLKVEPATGEMTSLTVDLSSMEDTPVLERFSCLLTNREFCVDKKVVPGLKVPKLEYWLTGKYAFIF